MAQVVTGGVGAAGAAGAVGAAGAAVFFSSREQRSGGRSRSERKQSVKSVVGKS